MRKSLKRRIIKKRRSHKSWRRSSDLYFVSNIKAYTHKKLHFENSVIVHISTHMCTYITCTYISICTYISMVWVTFPYLTLCLHNSPSVVNVSNKIYTSINFLSFHPLCLLYSPHLGFIDITT